MVKQYPDGYFDNGKWCNGTYSTPFDDQISYYHNAVTQYLKSDVCNCSWCEHGNYSHDETDDIPYFHLLMYGALIIIIIIMCIIIGISL